MGVGSPYAKRHKWWQGRKKQPGLRRVEAAGGGLLVKVVGCWDGCGV